MRMVPKNKLPTRHVCLWLLQLELASSRIATSGSIPVILAQSFLSVSPGACPSASPSLSLADAGRFTLQCNRKPVQRHCMHVKQRRSEQVCCSAQTCRPPQSFACQDYRRSCLQLGGAAGARKRGLGLDLVGCCEGVQAGFRPACK